MTRVIGDVRTVLRIFFSLSSFFIYINYTVSNGQCAVTHACDQVRVVGLEESKHCEITKQLIQILTDTAMDIMGA